MAKISVIIPVYNSSKYLKRCLNSVVNQDLKDIEIIIIDDNSTDNSLDIIRSYQHNDPRIKLVHLDKHSGPGKARNIGLEQACGKYIGFVDSDDYINSDMYSKLFSCAEFNNVEIARCDKAFMVFGLDYNKLVSFPTTTKKPVIIKPKKTPKYIEYENCECWNKIYKRDFIKNFRFNENIKYEDYPFVIDALGSADRIYCLREVMYYHRYRKDSISGLERKIVDKDILDIFECNNIIETYYKENGLYNTYSEVLKELFFNHAISKCSKLLTVKLPKKIKNDLINCYIRYLEIDNGQLLNNSMYINKKKSSFVFKHNMDYIEKNIINDKYSNINNKKIIMQKMKNLITENTGRN